MAEPQAAGGAAGIGSRFFDLWSRVYDLPVVQRLAYRPVHDAVAAELVGLSAERVIDVGCGTGLLTTRLHGELVGTVVGLDFSAGMLGHARRRDPTVSWIRGNSMALPFADGTVDALTCTESFHWYPDQPAALREFHRVLRPGGRALVALINPPLVALSRATAPGTVLGHSAHYPTPAEMATLVTDAGLEVDDQRRVWRLPAGPMLAATLTIAARR
jgi:ubiquinone/menaquinone biosynthesis C-methylase UbiE